MVLTPMIPSPRSVPVLHYIIMNNNSIVGTNCINRIITNQGFTVTLTYRAIIYGCLSLNYPSSGCDKVFFNPIIALRLTSKHL